jgi:hypothetical protein
MATAKKTPATSAEKSKKAAPVTAPVAKTAVAKPAGTKAIAAKPAEPKAAAAKPIAPKAVTPTTKPAVKAADKPTAKVVAPAKRAAAKVKKALDPAQRAHYVEVAAFYIAERRGFAAATPADDWLAAEAEIDRLIASGHFNQ